jgi:glycosyltransferase involved in cell wall biosynthesis
LKIIILSDYAFINGGNAQIALNTAVSLSKKNYDVTLFTAVGPVEDFLKNIPNLKVICLNQYDILSDPNRTRAIINGLWNFKARSEFKILLKNFDIKDTIIHIHSCSKALSSSCIQIANKMGFKMLYHLHDYGIACPNMGFYNYRQQKICRLNPLGMKCVMTNCDSRHYIHKIWRVVRQWIQENISGMPKNLDYIYISNFSYNILRPFLNKNNKAYYVSNPIDIEKRDRIKVEKNKEFIFIGRLVPEKNPMLLAEVAKKMKLSVTFIGSGPCENEIKNIYPSAKITGWINKEEIRKLLKITRCLIFPSNWYECQPLAVLECMSKGIPCISSKNCASSESIIEEYTGLLFINNDPIDLEEKIIKCQDYNYIKILSENAYKYYCDVDYDTDKYISKIIDVYNEILSL